MSQIEAVRRARREQNRPKFSRRASPRTGKEPGDSESLSRRQSGSMKVWSTLAIGGLMGLAVLAVTVLVAGAMRGAEVEEESLASASLAGPSTAANEGPRETRRSVASEAPAIPTAEKLPPATGSAVRGSMPPSAAPTENATASPAPQDSAKQMKPKEPERGEMCGTAIEFVPSPAEGAKLANQKSRLQFILHASGNFEDPQFT